MQPDQFHVSTEKIQKIRIWNQHLSLKERTYLTLII